MGNNSYDKTKTDLNVNSKYFSRFIIFSLLGVLLFLIPIPIDGSFNVMTGLLADKIILLLGDAILWFVVALLILCAVITPIASILKPKYIMDNKLLAEWFITTPLYIVSRILGAIIIVMCAFKIGPEMVISDATGQTIMGIMYPLVAIILAIVFFMPFLTDFGLMEYVGVFLRKITKPLFNLPGRSAINLITSWLAASNAAVILTSSQYKKGYYTKREASAIICCFSVINIPFCLVVMATIDVKEYFLQSYLTVTLVCIILAIVTPRIPPLSRIKNEYNPDTGSQSNELVPAGVKPVLWAKKLASDRASEFSVKNIFTNGIEMMGSIYIGTLPIVVAWGTIALIIVEYTPVFNWIAYPFGWYMDIMGVDHAFDAGPAAISGFIDMYIPALMVINIPSAATRWIIGTLSLIQIIFMTEVGILAIQAKVGLNVWNLFIVFLERTIIAIPLVVLAATLVF